MESFETIKKMKRIFCFYSNASCKESGFIYGGYKCNFFICYKFLLQKVVKEKKCEILFSEIYYRVYGL